MTNPNPAPLPIFIHDKAEIAAYLQKDAATTASNLYAFGDLDPFFWPYTAWYAQIDAQTDAQKHVQTDIQTDTQTQIQELALLYTGARPPVLLYFNDNIEFLRSLFPILPRYVYAHLHIDIMQHLSQGQYKDHGIYQQMILRKSDLSDPYTIPNIPKLPAHLQLIALSRQHLPIIKQLYQESYPNTWFDARMLDTNQYLGIYEPDTNTLWAIAGIHVYSPVYKVAALGNITVHPSMRGQKLAQIVTAHLCQQLLQTVDTIGLNVSKENTPAIRCYQNIGFQFHSYFREMELFL